MKKTILDDVIIVCELATGRITVKNSNNNFEKELFEIGFNKNCELYLLNVDDNDISKKIIIIKKLIKLNALFTYGNGWYPSEIVSYYKYLGLIDENYYVISWNNQNDFCITLI